MDPLWPRFGESVMAEVSYLIQDEAAKLLRLSPRTLERMRLEGTGPQFHKFGRRVVYKNDDLTSWANSRVFTSTSDTGAV
jgi:hypothetical protein